MEDDKALIERISHGDRQAFDTLVDRYYESLCAFSLRIVGDPEAARDVVQDALMRLWDGRRNIARVSFGKTYLYAIVKNLSFTFLRSASRSRPLVSIDEPSAEDLSRYFIEQETLRMVLEEIERLPPRMGEVLRLGLEGLRQEEIGARMGIAVATVKALKAEGLRKLRKKIGAAITLFALLV